MLKKLVIFLKTNYKKKIFFCLLSGILLLLIPNWIIIAKTKKAMLHKASNVHPSDTGIILGAAVYGHKHVSAILYDRIICAVELYKTGKVKNLLVSADHGQKKYYNEVSVIKYWLMKYQIPEKDIILDHAGYSTYESIFRAKELFHIKNAVIITQAFHLPRALYLARQKGIKAEGLIADRRRYKHIHWYITREYFARLKDFIFIHILKPKPV